MKLEPIVSSETSAIRTQTPVNYPKRNKLHLEHGESLKTRKVRLSCNKASRHRVGVLDPSPKGVEYSTQRPVRFTPVPIVQVGGRASPPICTEPENSHSHRSSIPGPSIRYIFYVVYIRWVLVIINYVFCFNPALPECYSSYRAQFWECSLPLSKPAPWSVISIQPRSNVPLLCIQQWHLAIYGLPQDKYALTISFIYPAGQHALHL